MYCYIAFNNFIFEFSDFFFVHFFNFIVSISVSFFEILEFFCNSLNYLVILLYSPVRTLFLFLNSRSLSMYSFVNFLSLLFKFISFRLSSSHKWTFSSCFYFNTCKLPPYFYVFKIYKAFISSRHFSKF